MKWVNTFTKRGTLAFCLFVIAVLGSLDSYALKDYNWEGDSGENWETAANWDNTPGSEIGFDYGINGDDYTLPGDDHPVIDASTDFTYNGNPYTINNLEISNGAQLTINDNTLDIGGTLLVHSGSSVIVGDGATLNATNVLIYDANTEITVSGTGNLAVSGSIGIGDDQGQGDGTNGTPQLTVTGGSVVVADLGFSNATGDTPRMNVSGNGSVTTTGDVTGTGGTIDIQLTGNGSINIQGALTMDDSGDELFATGNSDLTISDLSLDNTASFDYSGNSTVTINSSLDWGDCTMNLNVTPDLTGSILTLDGSSAQSVTFGGAVTLDGLVINNSLGVTLGSDFTIENTLTLSNGLLDVTGTTFTLEDNATYSGYTGSTYVVGTIHKVGNDAFTFPLQQPLGISAPSNVTDEFSASYTAGTPPGDFTKGPGLEVVSGLEYWDLNRDNGSSSVSVSLGWSSLSDILNLVDLRVVHWTGTEWEDVGSTGILGTLLSGTITSNLVSSFSPFTFGSATPSNPLPVELTKFDAQLKDGKVHLEWQTASEINNSHFELERSVDGVKMETIATIATKADGGNSSQMINYNHTDHNPNYGSNYYRLKQVDVDGTTEYHPFVFVNNTFQVLAEPSVYPNPVSSNKITLEIAEAHESSSIELISISGAKIPVDVIREGNTYSITSEIPLNSGFYALKAEIKSGDKVKTISKKVLVQ